MPEQQQAPPVPRVVLRPIISPLPLGLLALAAGTFTMAGLELSWISSAQSHAAGLVILTFTVPLQMVSFGYGFLARDPAAATGMGLQAGGWAAIGTVTLTSPPGRASGALGLILLGAGTVMLAPAAAAAASNVLAAAVMALTSLRFFLTAAYQLTAAPGWKITAGAAGLALAAVACYAGLAFELEDSHTTTVLPTFRRGTGQTAISGGPAEELEGIHREAGIRRKL